MALTPLDTVDDPLPSPTRPSEFNDDMDRFINTKLPRLAEEVDDVATAFTLNATNSTSTSSVSIGTGTKNYTVQTSKSYVKGMFVIAADNAAPSTNYNYGQVLSYDTGTGALSIDVTNSAGTGTKTSWIISQTAPGGVTTAGATFIGDILVPDEAYDATAWNGNLEVPTKNAVRDILEVAATTSALGRVELATDAEAKAGTSTSLVPSVSSMVAAKIQLGTPTATTSLTSHDYTSIPSWVKKIKLKIYGVSTNGTSNLKVQLGDSGGIETTGYLGATSNASTTANFTDGLGLTVAFGAANVLHGTVIIHLADSATNTWVMTYTGSLSNAATVYLGTSTKALSSALDRIRITANGTDTFDAGSINISME